MKTILNLLRYCAYLPIYVLSSLFPKSNGIWVFGARNGIGYCDNSKYVFEFVASQSRPITAIWVTRSKRILELVRSKGFYCYRIGTLPAFWYCLRASVFFITHNKDTDLAGPLVTHSSLLIHTWHGTPLKKIAMDDPDRRESSRHWRVLWLKHNIFPFTREYYDALCSASDEVTGLLKSGFRDRHNQILLTGYARNDGLLKGDIHTFKHWRTLSRYDFLIAYIPTFRGAVQEEFTMKRDFAGSAFDEEFFQLQELDVLLKKYNALFIIKPHYYEAIRNAGVLSALRGNQNFLLIEDDDFEGSDIYPLIGKMDILITDYSSIYFDFLLIDKPIIFFAYDLERYKEDRGLYYEYDQVTPGPKVKSWAELFISLQNCMEGKDAHQPQRAEIKHRFNAYTDASSAERTAAETVRLLSSQKKT